MAACCSLAASAQSVKLNGVYQNNRYTDSEKNHSEYLGWNAELGKSIFIVDNGLYTMTWDGNSLTTPEKEPPVVKADIKGSECASGMLPLATCSTAEPSPRVP